VSQALTLRIGTRGSQLALWQSRTVAGLLEARGVRVDLVVIKTSGDRLQEAPLAAAGGKRLFVKEIEDALLRGDVHLAVHSAKDMPALLPDGLDVAATLPREDPRDALVLPPANPPGDLATSLTRLRAAPAIGTSSVRRAAQLASLVPGGRFVPIRGNVDSRLRKLDSGGFDALVLASAGMKRLGLGGRISAPIPIDRCVPAPGQGIIAIETRADDGATRRALEPIHDLAAGIALAAERALVNALGGGCQLPLGGIVLHNGTVLDMHAVVTSLDGQRVVRRHAQGIPNRPEDLGKRVAQELAQGGAREILDEVRGGKP
jgi:hydroxymethylbilane synthase